MLAVARYCALYIAQQARPKLKHLPGYLPKSEERVEQKFAWSLAPKLAWQVASVRHEHRPSCQQGQGKSHTQTQPSPNFFVSHWLSPPRHRILATSSDTESIQKLTGKLHTGSWRAS